MDVDREQRPLHNYCEPVILRQKSLQNPHVPTYVPVFSKTFSSSDRLSLRCAEVLNMRDLCKLEFVDEPRLCIKLC